MSKLIPQKLTNISHFTVENLKVKTHITSIQL